MGKKQPFIKGKSVTFRLTPTVDQSPPIIGNPELVNVVSVTDEELTEREKYGIYYADNYNYMSHLKARNELTECTIPDRNMLGTSKVATNIVEIKGKEIPLVFADASRPSVSRPAEVDGADEIDPEIMEMLNEEAVDGFDEGGDLEDNFLELAGGVDLPEGRRIYEEFRRATGPELSDSEIDEDDVMSGGDIGDEEMINDNMPKSHSILKNAAPISMEKKELDERFNQFYECMAGSDQDDENSNEEEEEEEVDKTHLERIAGDYIEEKERLLYERPDDLSKKLSLRSHKCQEKNRDEETREIEVELRSKRPKWDCESITSTYSNIYNHPTIIREAPKRKPNKKEVSKTSNDGDVEMNDETGSVCNSGSVALNIRFRGEAAEERRQRKKAVKEERRERRQEKKQLKEVFKDEKKLKNAQRGHVYVPGRPLS